MMTDGPFKNSALSRGWKRFADALLNDASTPDERAALACHSLLNDVLDKDTRDLLNDLKGHAQRSQLELDPLSSTSEVFDRHLKLPFADTLQKHLNQNLYDKMAPDAALDRALAAAARECLGDAQNRITEECIHVRDTEDMTDNQFRQAIGRNREAFDLVNAEDICRAIHAGNKNAFKAAIAKKEGLDEGPDE